MINDFENRFNLLTKTTVEKKINQLTHFLKPYTTLWSNEVLNRYPHSLNVFDPEWITDLEKLSADEIFDFDSRRNVKKLEGTKLQCLLDEIQNLTHLPYSDFKIEEPLEAWAFKGVKEKKRHEIQRIIPTVKMFKSIIPFNHVIDIGGGVGHLARTLAHYHGIETYTFDMEKQFQEQGKQRAKKFRLLPIAKPLHFVNIRFGDAKKESVEEKKLQEIVHANAFVVGLHTCGNLANKVIQTSMEFKTRGLLSFGCCYHKLDPVHEFKISKYYKEHALDLNVYSLTLGTRAHCATTRSDYETKKLVKYFRYILHFWLNEKHHIKDLFDVGENNVRDYHGKFSAYAIPKLQKLNLAIPLSKELDEYFDYHANSKNMYHLYLANLIRWQFGKVLEHYILFDRVMYLLENGYKVRMETFFEEELSPRNIGIMAYK